MRRVLIKILDGIVAVLEWSLLVFKADREHRPKKKT